MKEGQWLYFTVCDAIVYRISYVNLLNLLSSIAWEDFQKDEEFISLNYSPDLEKIQTTLEKVGGEKLLANSFIELVQKFEWDSLKQFLEFVTWASDSPASLKESLIMNDSCYISDWCVK